MATEVRWRRGTETEHDTFTGAEGEVTVNTTDKRAVVHDGSTAGGHPAAKEDEVAKKSNNLSDLDSAATARSNLGLGSAATHEDSEYEDAGTAQSIMDTHEAASDPHTQYAQLSGGASANFSSAPQVGGDQIVESGEDSNTRWTKFSDGTLLLELFDRDATYDGNNNLLKIDTSAPVDKTTSFHSASVSITSSTSAYSSGISRTTPYTVVASGSSLFLGYDFSTDGESITNGVHVFLYTRWK